MKTLVTFLAITFLLTGCSQQPTNTTTQQSGDVEFKKLHDQYVVEFLRRNPTVSTYLGGSGLDSSLKDVEGKLRDHSAAALQSEDRWLTETQKAIEGTNSASLTAANRINRDVILAQTNFLLRQHQVRRHQERAIDTYVEEPFRAVDWQLVALTQTGDKTYGTPEEWNLVISRVKAVPAFLNAAKEQLNAGIKSNNTPDWRMLIRHGLEGSDTNTNYFEQTLLTSATERLAPAQRDATVSQLRDATKSAADAYRDFRSFIASNFFDDPAKKDNSGLKPQFRADRYARGDEEYNWAVKNNLRVNKTASQLFDEAMPIVETTRQEMFELARKVGEKRGLTLPAEGPAAVRAVFDDLSKEYPKSDAEMIQWYRDAATRLIDYARRTGSFDVPNDYKLEIIETPPPLRASVDGAVYYPAPPFKNTGVGRFYVTPTGNNTAALQAHNRAAVADLAAHEGFPGHDWHFKVMTQYRDEIAAVRWLTPGAVEDSSSMWEDSMAMEGWGLYSEALMAEPLPGAPEGFYSPEERLYQLRGKLYRDLRVRIDTGIHTNRMSYAEAVDLFSEVVDFLPGKCIDASPKSEAKQASCNSSERAIFRYSKWPTQAITYRLGKDEIFALRKEASALLGDRFSPKTFHVLFMKQGTIPAGYFREELLRELQK
ncbi:MAG TPA: DUF885 domain-containing protein [Pyrinomonadaceae bacterium]